MQLLLCSFLASTLLVLTLLISTLLVLSLLVLRRPLPSMGPTLQELLMKLRALVLTWRQYDRPLMTQPGHCSAWHGPVLLRLLQASTLGPGLRLGGGRILLGLRFWTRGLCAGTGGWGGSRAVVLQQQQEGYLLCSVCAAQSQIVGGCLLSSVICGLGLSQGLVQPADTCRLG